MTDEMTNHGHGGHGVEFEREDLSTRAIFGFMIGLAITGIVIYVIITGMYKFLDHYEQSQANTGSPLVKSNEVGARHIAYAPGHGDYVQQRFSENGAPMLEYDEKGQFRDFLMKQEQELNSYGWVDEKAGVAHIPIERAMQLVAERGLPVKPEGAAVTAVPAQKTPGSTPKAKQ